jgi:hypothetical protein
LAHNWPKNYVAIFVWVFALPFLLQFSPPQFRPFFGLSPLKLETHFFLVGAANAFRWGLSNFGPIFRVVWEWPGRGEKRRWNGGNEEIGGKADVELGEAEC